jgi:hypothetical protein
MIIKLTLIDLRTERSLTRFLLLPICVSDSFQHPKDYDPVGFSAEALRRVSHTKTKLEAPHSDSGRYARKKSNVHAAAFVGHTVGDPLKDTSGPALNIVMKLMAIISICLSLSLSSAQGNHLGHFLPLSH